MATETDNLIKLIISTDGIVHSWLRLLFTVEAGMVVIIGFVLRPSSNPSVPLDPGFRSAVGLVVPLFGIIFAVGIGYITLLERKWVGWYVERLKSPNLSPTIMPPDKAISKQPIGNTGIIIIVLLSSIAVGWIYVIVTLKPWH